MSKQTKRVPETAGVAVYCGPDLPGIARRYTVCRNGIPAPLAEAMADDPALRPLLVPLPQFPEAMRSIQKRSGRFYQLYCLAQAKRKEA